MTDLPQSDAVFVKAYYAETAEAISDGHVEVFASFGSIPRSIVYDNTRLVVAQILGDGTRKRNHRFAALQCHSIFEDRYGRPAKGNVTLNEGKGHDVRAGYDSNYEAFNLARFRALRQRIQDGSAR